MPEKIGIITPAGVNKVLVIGTAMAVRCEKGFDLGHNALGGCAIGGFLEFVPAQWDGRFRCIRAGLTQMLRDLPKMIGFAHRMASRKAGRDDGVKPLAVTAPARQQRRQQQLQILRIIKDRDAAFEADRIGQRPDRTKMRIKCTIIQFLHRDAGERNGGGEKRSPGAGQEFVISGEAAAAAIQDLENPGPPHKPPPFPRRTLHRHTPFGRKLVEQAGKPRHTRQKDIEPFQQADIEIGCRPIIFEGIGWAGPAIAIHAKLHGNLTGQILHIIEERADRGGPDLIRIGAGPDAICAIRIGIGRSRPGFQRAIQPDIGNGRNRAALQHFQCFTIERPFDILRVAADIGDPDGLRENFVQ